MSFSLYAQQTSIDSLQTLMMDSVTVTATRLHSRPLSATLSVSSLGATQLQRGQQQLALSEALVSVPGLFAINPDNFAQDLRIAIRGSGARAAFGIRGIKILVDGIPESTPDGQAQVDNIDLGLLTGAEVIRGPSSGLYGNASGGVISLRSQDPPAAWTADARATWGSFGLQRYQLGLGQQKETFGYWLYAAHTSLDGYRTHSEAENNLLNAKLNWRPAKKAQLTLLLNYLDSPLANDPGGINQGQADEDPTSARDVNVNFDAGEALTQGRAALIYDQEISDRQHVQVRAFHLFREFENKLPFEGGGIVHFDRTFQGLSGHYAFQGSLASLPYQLKVGWDAEWQRDDRKRYDNLLGEQGALSFDQEEKFTAVGLYLLQSIQFTERLRMRLSLRQDWLELAAEDAFLPDGDDSGDLSFRQFNPVVGLNYRLGSFTHLYGNIATSFETPALTELSANPSGGGGFNPDLKPQTATNYELGFRGWIEQKFRYEVAAFYIQGENELVPYELEDFPGRTFYRNAGSTQKQGVEFSGMLFLHPMLTAQTQYTYSDFTYDAYQVEGNDFSGNVLPALPKHMGYGGLIFQHPRGFYARTGVRFVGELYTNDANTVTDEAYGVWDLRLSWEKAGKNWTWEPFFGLNNLLDTRYNGNIRINAFGQRFFEPGPGRAVFAGLRIRFQQADRD